VVTTVWIAWMVVGLTADPEVRVTTTEGEAVQGTLDTASFRITTDFGSAVVDSEHVASILFGEPDVITTTGGVELRGEIALTRLRLKTEKGSRSIRRADLGELTSFGEGGAPARGVDFTGRWSGSFGPMRLEQVGGRVSGTYGFDDEFSLEGKVTGRRFEFRYREPSTSGEGWFEMWEDGDTFLGELRTASGQTRKWNGYRIEHRLAEPAPGEIATGQSQSYLNYYLRAPRSWDGEKEYPAIAIFHGSNMSARGYVETMARLWPDLAEDYVLVGFDGERLSPSSRPGRRVYNATYVNFSGHEVWHKWAYRQTPALAAEALDELREALPIRHFFVGGHSQGGYLTFAIAMFYPEKIAGAFPMSCALLVQCEPDAFSDPEVRRAQRQVPFAIVHGREDTVVRFSSSRYSYERFQDEGFPALRLFAPEGVGHVFDHLPLPEAIRWLEAMASGDAGELARFAEKQWIDERYRDASAALERARALDPGSRARERLASLEERLEREAAAHAKRIEAAMRENGGGSWVDDFWEFREAFGLTRAARGALERYAELRARHAAPANDLFQRARSERDPQRRKRLYRELVEEHYASKWYPLAKRLAR